MSRLDWFTILIVSICVVALGFLVYKTVQLMGNDQPNMQQTELSEAEEDRNEHQTAYEASGSPRTDAATAPGADDQDLDDDELPYDPEEVEAPEQEATPAPAQPSKTATEKTSTAAAQPKSQPASSSTTRAKGGTPTSYNSTGEFMVVAGSFSMRYNAETQVKKLKQLGYDNARVEIFNSGALATALVDRFDNYDRAKSLVNELKGKGVDCFVKKKQ